MILLCILLILILSIILIILLNDRDTKNIEQKKRMDDVNWLHIIKAELEKDQYGKKPYYYLYEIPPSINGDFYNGSREKYDSPHFNFIIYYSKCIYENSATCVNCTRRREINCGNGYCYGASHLCYDIKELDMKD